mmetsp:Transcript_2254/g.7081  ORF Transcript_2254/g.7081 Transcript_2254/m.7081 type:complete len:239 (+) Transcript_2254:1213-1929(+)
MRSAGMPMMAACDSGKQATPASPPAAPATTSVGKKCSDSPALWHTRAPGAASQRRSRATLSAAPSDSTSQSSKAKAASMFGRRGGPKSTEKLWIDGTPDPTTTTPWARSGASASPIARCAAGSSVPRSDTATTGTPRNARRQSLRPWPRTEPRTASGRAAATASQRAASLPAKATPRPAAPKACASTTTTPVGARGSVFRKLSSMFDTPAPPPGPWFIVRTGIFSPAWGAKVAVLPKR